MKRSEVNSDIHLVLLPGLDGTGKLFDPFVKQFPDPTRITVIPYPMKKHISFDMLGDYIVSLLPLDTPLVILGESYSGPVALRLATRDDINIKALILVATFAKYPESLLKTVSRLLPLSFLFRLPIPDFIIHHYCFGNTDNTVLAALLRESVRDNEPNVLARRAREGAQVDVTESLSKITIPCMYIAPGDDKLVPGSAVKYLKAHLPNMDVVTIQGAHFILQLQPKACYDSVNRFLLSSINRRL